MPIEYLTRATDDKLWLGEVGEEALWFIYCSYQIKH
jgi:hypothetical protein